MPDEPSTFLIYSSAGCETGPELAEAVGVDDWGTSCDERYDYLIRWGTTQSVRYAPSIDVINSKSSLERNTDKYNSLQLMEEAGVNVPPYSTDPDDLSYPMLGRSRNHTRGEDINLILQQRDIRLTSNDFYVQYIPTHLEYRVHVMCGGVLKVHEKRLRREEDNHPYIRNAETGWVFANPRGQMPNCQMATDAVEAIGMDFGAVDMIRSEEEEEYILEVNSAPSLDETNLEIYKNKLQEVVFG